MIVEAMIDGGLSEQDARDRISLFDGHGLIEPSRKDLDPPQQVYAHDHLKPAKRLAEAGEREAARRAHLAHMTELAEAAQPYLLRAEQLVWLARLEAERQGEARLREAFGALSAEALRQNNRSFLELAEAKLSEARRSATSELELRRRAVDDLVRPITAALERVDGRIREVEKERKDMRADERGESEGDPADGEPAAVLHRALCEIGGLTGKEHVSIDVISPLVLADDSDDDVGSLLAGEFMGDFGGFLDRLDSVIFAAPVFFHLTRFWWSTT